MTEVLCLTPKVVLIQETDKSPGTQSNLPRALHDEAICPFGQRHWFGRMHLPRPQSPKQMAAQSTTINKLCIHEQ